MQKVIFSLPIFLEALSSCGTPVVPELFNTTARLSALPPGEERRGEERRGERRGKAAARHRNSAAAERAKEV